jgi:hypothetical protein
LQIEVDEDTKKIIEYFLKNSLVECGIKKILPLVVLLFFSSQAYFYWTNDKVKVAPSLSILMCLFFLSTKLWYERVMSKY